MAEQAASRLTLDEFLELEGRPEVKEELIDGRVVAMAPPKDAHGTIAVNAAFEIRGRLKRPCRGVSEAGIRVDEHNLFAVDLAVTCSPPDAKGMTVDPVLLVEVLSPSTRSFDLGVKADAYSQILSCREIWLVDSERRWLRLWRREGESWIVSLPLTGSAEFRSEVLDATIGLEALYAESGL